jgi:hypothetical protein
MFKFYVSFVDKKYLCVEVFGNYIEKVLTNKGASYIMITWQYSSKGCYYG